MTKASHVSPDSELASELASELDPTPWDVRREDGRR